MPSADLNKIHLWLAAIDLCGLKRELLYFFSLWMPKHTSESAILFFNLSGFVCPQSVAVYPLFFVSCGLCALSCLSCPSFYQAYVGCHPAFPFSRHPFFVL